MQKTQKEKLSRAERQLRPIRIPMPLRYLINALLIAGLWGLMTFLIAQGVITNYWTGILITTGINIILAVSLNVATGYLGQLPLGHAGFMAVGAYTGGILMKAPAASRPHFPRPLLRAYLSASPGICVQALSNPPQVRSFPLR